MGKFKAFLKRKDIEISARRYGIDALGAMAQGLFCSLLIGTIINTIGQQFGIEYLTTIGGYATAMSGPAMAVAIGYALQCPPLVLFSLIAVGSAANGLGGAGGPLAVLVIAIIAAEIGKAVSKETKVDILVTPLVTICVGRGAVGLVGPAPSARRPCAVGQLIMWATELQPFWMGILVSVVVGIALTLPISSAAICAALGPDRPGGRRGRGGLLRPDGGLRRHVLQGEPLGRPGQSGHRHLHAPDGQHRPQSPHLARPPSSPPPSPAPSPPASSSLEMNGAPVLLRAWAPAAWWGRSASTPAGSATWPPASSPPSPPLTGSGLVLVCFILAAVLTYLFGQIERKLGWIKEGDLKLD